MTRPGIEPRSQGPRANMTLCHVRLILEGLGKEILLVWPDFYFSREFNNCDRKKSKYQSRQTSEAFLGFPKKCPRKEILPSFSSSHLATSTGNTCILFRKTCFVFASLKLFAHGHSRFDSSFFFQSTWHFGHFGFSLNHFHLFRIIHLKPFSPLLFLKNAFAAMTMRRKTTQGHFNVIVRSIDIWSTRPSSTGKKMQKQNIKKKNEKKKKNKNKARRQKAFFIIHALKKNL